MPVWIIYDFHNYSNPPWLFIGKGCKWNNFKNYFSHSTKPILHNTVNTICIIDDFVYFSPLWIDTSGGYRKPTSKMKSDIQKTPILVFLSYYKWNFTLVSILTPFPFGSSEIFVGPRSKILCGVISTTAPCQAASRVQNFQYTAYFRFKPALTNWKIHWTPNSCIDSAGNSCTILKLPNQFAANRS